MGTKKRVEPKPTATKTKKADKTDSDRKAERKTQRYSFSDAGIKHAVTRLG